MFNVSRRGICVNLQFRWVPLEAKHFHRLLLLVNISKLVADDAVLQEITSFSRENQRKQ